MGYCMIETAFGNLDEAKKVIDRLLEEKLVASCQMLESNSKWNWKNEIEESKEYIVLMKTKKSLQEKIYAVIKGIHSYDCFEFAVFNLESNNQDYLNWIEEETNG
ncbi:MAG: divalent-cation tolerance protein CutA [Clostridia bacterium]|nr:divalent-cation tolerance protein CutA [Clostridia bacterium]